MGKEQTGASEVTEQGLPKLVNSDKPKFFGLWNESMNTLDAYMKSNNKSVESWSDRTRQNSVDVNNLQERGSYVCRNVLSKEDGNKIASLSELTTQIILSFDVTSIDGDILYSKKQIHSKDTLIGPYVEIGGYCTYRFALESESADIIQLITKPSESLGNAWYIFCEIRNKL